ncbi:MAG TPA: DUF2784 domain-containing protein [Burkholderiaceae bacterium]|nr:DUF2784 domain-containing protein [Burkholderiaceae bacterium]
MPWRALADAVLVLHLGVVAFVVGGLVAIVAGNLRGRAWARSPAFRAAHLAAIGVVALQAWLGRTCPLTTLESWLRTRAGSAGYETGFVEHWVARALYWDAPPWAFTLAYTAFAAAVALAWRRWPPRPFSSARRRGAAAASGRSTS